MLSQLQQRHLMTCVNFGCGTYHFAWTYLLQLDCWTFYLYSSIGRSERLYTKKTKGNLDKTAHMIAIDGSQRKRKERSKETAILKEATVSKQTTVSNETMVSNEAAVSTKATVDQSNTINRSQTKKEKNVERGSDVKGGRDRSTKYDPWITKKQKRKGRRRSRSIGRI